MEQSNRGSDSEQGLSTTSGDRTYPVPSRPLVREPSVGSLPKDVRVPVEKGERRRRVRVGRRDVGLVSVVWRQSPSTTGLPPLVRTSSLEKGVCT